MALMGSCGLTPSYGGLNFGLTRAIKDSSALENLDQRVKEEQAKIPQPPPPPPPPPVNHAPEVGNFSPSNNVIGVATSGTTLRWTASDPDGDAVISDVYFGTISLVLVATNIMDWEIRTANFDFIDIVV
ncbi:MAG: hypothetical protein V1649_00890 [Patescibacteria group bacterium]